MRGMFCVSLLVFSSCALDGPYVWVDELPDRALTPSPYRIQPGDRLMVNVWNQAPLSGEVLVRPDGNITLPLIGDVAALGKTPPQVSDDIKNRLASLVVEPHVSVSVSGTREPNVSVVGEVRQAGSYPLRPGEGVLELLARAGGLSEFAARDKIYVIRRHDGMRVRFRYEKLARADGAGVRFMLQDGDVIVVD